MVIFIRIQSPYIFLLGIDNKSAYFLVYLSEKSLNPGIYPTLQPIYADILGLGGVFSATTPNGSNVGKDKFYHNYVQFIPKKLQEEVKLNKNIRIIYLITNLTSIE
jgi:hypothetical protein